MDLKQTWPVPNTQKTFEKELPHSILESIWGGAISHDAPYSADKGPKMLKGHGVHHIVMEHDSKRDINCYVHYSGW